MLVGGTTTAGKGLVHQTDIPANYSGYWFQNAGGQYSGGNVNLVVDAGAHVDLTFDGTAVTWIGYRDEWSGVANVYVDGVEKTQIDTYLSPSRAQTTLYTITNLTSGSHTLTVEATGARSESALASWVWIDSFDVVR